MPGFLADDLRKFVLTLCEDVATPRALTVSILLRYDEFDQLAMLQTDPLSYLDPLEFKKDSAVSSFLKKLPDLPTTFDRKAVAVENFFKSEKECLSTNLRLAPFVDGVLAHPDDWAIFDFILECRKEAIRILGPCPLDLRGRFGPGSTYSDRGVLTTVPDKMSTRPTFTPSASSHLLKWKDTAWARACADDGNPPRCVSGNRFTTVPKDCTKDRGIAVEPSINVFFQLAYGQVIRQRLARAGITLKSSQVIHRQVAREASISGSYATIDLSNASDTLCINLVKLILPPSWFQQLNAVRSRTTLVEGKTYHLEKFSSMGNGYTFELETLIFLILSRVASGLSSTEPGVNLFVYGDDIIVPTDKADKVLAVLRYFGFTPNEKKTFIEGFFRESCGGDYFNGMDVRPYYQKRTPNEPQDYISMANGIRRMAHSNGEPNPFHCISLRTWHRILDAIPSHIRRLRGPEGLGDIVIHDSQQNWDGGNTRWRYSIRYVKCYTPVRFRRISWAHFRPHIVLATALYGVGDGARGITPRDAVLGYAPRWVPFS